MKTLKYFFGWLIAGLALIQFVRIDVPPAPKASPGEEIDAPAPVKTALKRSCYDCHSNHTRWPWYSDIAPISWEVRSHVRDGRNWLNFSIWKRYDEKKKVKFYKQIADSVDWKMPPADYLWIHKDARLSPEEKRRIKEWALSHVPEDER
ncbi:heme-binding domain-containing protein [Nitratifractor sp.]